MDFGLSKQIEQGNYTEQTSKEIGTYFYLPPEWFNGNGKLTNKVDVWSCGIVLYQLLFGVKPYGNNISQ